MYRKTPVPEACNFIKKESLTQVFSFEFCEISKNTFFTEHLGTTTSLYSCPINPEGQKNCYKF